MGEIHNVIEIAVSIFSRAAVQQLLRSKLVSVGISSDEIVDQLTDSVLTNSGGSIEFEWLADLEISFDNSDLEELKARIDRFVVEILDLIENLSSDLAQKIILNIIEHWDGTPPFEASTAHERSRVIKDWGQAIDSLRVLVAICEREGHEFNIRHLKSRRRNFRDQALARLHIRSCRIANEIILLLEHGYTEGAQGRWRTLHEVAVIATLIGEGGDSLAERFFDHEAVERQNWLNDVRRSVIAGSETTINIAEASEIERNFGRKIAKYGKHFKGMYGWASGQLGLSKEPKFHDLQDAAGSLCLKDRFRVASSGNHASVVTLGQPIHNWDRTATVPGVYSPGFDAPGVDTAQAIVQITATLYHEPFGFDQLVRLRVLAQLLEDTANIWRRTARQIDTREQRAINRALRFSRKRHVGYVKAKPVKRI